MKKLFAIAVALMGCMVVQGQEVDIELTADGGYEKKVVVEVDSTSAGVLFGRAMEALSDWSGPDGKARAGLDYHDKESGTVIYKGRFSLGILKKGLLAFDRYANFVLKVRCKDGRAQVAVTVPNLTGIEVSTGRESTGSLGEVAEQMKTISKKRQERGVELFNDIKSGVDIIVTAMAERLKRGVDDDF